MTMFSKYTFLLVFIEMLKNEPCEYFNIFWVLFLSFEDWRQ
jgi:hypothetical protein